MLKSAASFGLVMIVGSLGGYLVTLLGVPGGWIIGAIAAAYLARAFKAPVSVPSNIRSIAMGFAGMTVGAAIDERLLGNALQLSLSLLAMFFLLSLLSWLTYLLHRRGWGTSKATAVSCAWPGNVLMVFAGAQALNADMERVTVVQLVRVLILMGILPLVIGTFHSAAPEPEVAVTLDLALAAGLALLCVALAVRVNLVGGEMFFSAFAIGALSATGVLDFDIPPEGLAFLQVVVGVYIGLALACCSRAAVRAALAPSLAGAVLATVLTLAGGLAFSTVLDFPAAALALAFAPGGAEAMILLSAVFDVDPGFVGIHHTMRLIIMTFCLPFVLRYFTTPPAGDRDRISGNRT